jgi:hypothetical protein
MSSLVNRLSSVDVPGARAAAMAARWEADLLGGAWMRRLIGVFSWHEVVLYAKSL